MDVTLEVTSHPQVFCPFHIVFSICLEHLVQVLLAIIALLCHEGLQESAASGKCILEFDHYGPNEEMVFPRKRIYC